MKERSEFLKELKAHNLIVVRFRKLVKEENLSFTVRYFGNRTLLIRKELEKYLEEHPEARRDLHGWKKFRSKT
ncbi:hypothetical protein SAMN02910451_00705 [Butyrivibrio hungatei]|uniref:Uncharacterized protein n=1 Tax=Butyrivibrio hungatei TaxID=185008 RepID=A0A1G5BFC0_9FIRM|nr:hypothetical protein [Butyrivibrio hungatei]SCX88892.1 hypothetical protein SAMN02910451_00705 [Butyrivibrio hungatei]